MNSNKNKKITSFFSWLQKLFWGFAFAVSLFFVIIYFQRYLAGWQWHKAHDLATTPAFSHPSLKRRGIKYAEAENIYSDIYPKLKWNGRFLFYYGNVKLRNEKYFEAIELFEKAKFTYPDPYLFENLGSAYINYQLSLTNKKSRCEATNKAIHYWILASNILPWRLTPKFYLADLFYQLGETNEAIKYAQLVVDTPMKKWTERGKEFKLKSQKMLNELGEPGSPATNLYCDDPGLVVFDINDKKTWNVGKW